MKKIIITLAIFLLFMCTACSGDNSIADNKTLSDFFSDPEYTDDNYIGDNLWLNNITDFSEGRAWIQFHESDRNEGSVDAMIDAAEAAMGSDTERFVYGMQNYSWQGNNRAALIDTQGKILWESELTENSIVLEKMSDFKDGMAYFIFNGNDGKSYNIINSDGNVTFTKEFDENFFILGHGGGLCLAAEHVVDFDTDEWRIGAIDKNGDTVIPFMAYELKSALDNPAPVEEPSDNSAELQKINDALEQLEEERQVWLEEVWDYQGETNEEYYKRIDEIEKEFVDQRMELEERRNQIRQEYEEQLELYQEYQQALDEYMYNSPAMLSLDSDYNGCEYLGENIFRLFFWNGDVLLNIATQSIIYSSDYNSLKHISSYISDFENGAATVLYEEAGVGYYSIESICSLGTDGSITPVVTNVWAKNFSRICYYPEFSEGLIFIPYSEGDNVYIDTEYYNQTQNFDAAHENSFVLHTGAYLNIEGEAVIDFPEYNGKYDYYCGQFYNGYALMTIIGKDELTYFTVINKNGDLMFDPKSGFDTVCISEDGKYLTAYNNGSITVFDVTGNPLVSVDYVGISLWDKQEDFKYNVCDGVIKINDFYVNVEKGTVIGLHGEGDTNFSVTVY